MLVVENTEVPEIKKFFVLDAMLQLGEVQRGTNIDLFDPSRAYAYFTRLENHLYSLVSRYTDAFLYVPRRTYSHLTAPPILSDIYASVQKETTTCWLVDQFLSHPIANIGDMVLSDSQRTRNIELCRSWANSAPYGPRHYISQDLRWNRMDVPGWGCIIRAADILRAIKGPYKRELLEYIHRKMPVIIELYETKELDILLEWLVMLRQRGVTDFSSLFFSIQSHREWAKEITRLAEIPGTKILTAGATVSSLLSLIQHLKEVRGDDWSTGIAFGSNYPPTQMGDSISEILSFLLSRRLAAQPGDLQRILGGNLLVRLPPTPSFLRMYENESSIVASGNLGKAAQKEFMRILQVLTSRGGHSVAAVGFTATPDAKRVDTNSAIITIKENISSTAANLVVRIEHDGTFRISGWKRIINEGLRERRSDILTTLVRSATTGGDLLELPSHLQIFTDLLLKCLRVTETTDILSAMHFSTIVDQHDEIQPHTIGMCSSDINALSIRQDDLVLILDTTNSQWWVARVREIPVKQRTVSIPRVDASMLGVDSDHQIDVLKFEGEVIPVKSALFEFAETDRTTIGETVAYVHLHNDEIVKQLSQIHVGRGTRLCPIISSRQNSAGHVAGSSTISGSVAFRMVSSTPEINTGNVGDFSTSTFHFRPKAVLADINLILCMLFGSEVNSKSRRIKLPRMGITRLFDGIPNNVQYQNEFISRLDKDITVRDITALVGLHILDMFTCNRSGGRLGIVKVTDRPDKFTIQKGAFVQSYLELAEDIKSSEVRTSAKYFILDTLRETRPEIDRDGMFRVIAELLEDFGESRPTLIVIVTDQLGEPGDKARPYISSLLERDRHHICLIESNGDGTKSSSIFAKEGKVTRYQIEGYIVQQIDSIILTAVEHLLAT